ncbi:MAG TPA: hypothetical protein DDZ51_05260 [Planctomycetaceae bacterium]|nr:hypothetical protein [Planctomycetaceae bacterium]
MKFGNRLWFCLTDVFSKPSIAITLAILSTLLSVTTTMVTSFGLAFGIGNVNTHRIESEPLSGCVLVGDGIRTKQRFESADFEHVESFLRQKLPASTGFTGVFGFREVPLTVITSDGSTWTLYGRTASMGTDDRREDPVFAGLRRISTSSATPSADQSALYVSTDFLTQCGLQAQTLPLTIRCKVKELPVELRVTGVVDRLPYRWDFVMAEDIDRWLAQTDDRASIKVDQVTTGTAPTQWWPLLQQVGDGQGEHFDRFVELAGQANRRVNGQRFDLVDHRLSLAMTDAPLQEWSILLRMWIKGFPALDQPDADMLVEQFLNLETGILPEHSLEDDRYDMAGIYTSDLSLMQSIADLASEVHWRQSHSTANDGKMFGRLVERESAEKVARADEQTRTALKIVTGFSFVIALVGSIGLLTILFLKAKSKSSEAGMMRVIGFSNQSITQLRLIEAFVLWIPSILGIPLGIALGKYLSHQQYAGDAMAQQIGYHLTITHALSISLGCLVASVFFMQLSVMICHRSDPILLLER